MILCYLTLSFLEDPIRRLVVLTVPFSFLEVDFDRSFNLLLFLFDLAERISGFGFALNTIF